MRPQHRRPPFWYLRRRPPAVRAEIDEELELHLQMRMEQLMAQGLPADRAREAAVRQFGDLESTRRYCQHQEIQKERLKMRELIFQDLAQDVRISGRSLLRAPMLTLTIVATVGLGIGATTVIFSAINAALLQPLPYAEPERLVRLYTDARPFRFRFSLADYLALQAQQTHFERVTAYTNRAMSFSDGVVAERVFGKVVSPTYFSVLGITPALGRDFSEPDSGLGKPPVAILSYGFWRERLGARPDVVGRPIRIDGAEHVVVGVLPQAVGPLEQQQDLFVAGQWPPPQRKGPFLYTVLGRLRDGASRASAAGELREINRRMFPLWKSSYQDDKATWAMMDLKAYVVGDVGLIAGLALAAVALVWLIACANASSLLIARVTSRRRELAVRSVLGASRARVVRYLLAESSLLALGSAVLGLAIAWAGMGLLRGVGPDYFPRTQEAGFDGAVLWLLAGVTAASALLFGLIPAAHGSGGRLDDSLRSSGRSATGSVSVRRLRAALVAGQFAIATPLLVVAGLLLASLYELRRVDLGFDSRNLLTASLQLPDAQYAESARIVSFYDELKRRLEVLPGVTGVAFADGRPPNDVGNFNNFDLEAFPTPPGQSQPVTPWVAVSPEYFQVLGLELLEGRRLDERDLVEDAVRWVVVDRAWARRFFPNGSAVGKRFREGGCTSCEWTTVVGVVSEVKYAGLDQPDQGTVYTPLGSGTRNVLLRTATEPTSVIPALRRIVRELDPTLPVSSIATIDELVAQSLQTPRSLSVLVASLAAIALALSMIGIYGVMSYYVQQHLRDIGIRVALGGRPGDVLRLVLQQGMVVVASGIVVGLLAAFFVTRLMSSLLFGVGATDPVAFAGAGAFLLGVALMACFLPARRAMGLEPAVVLRNE
ncbi:MAG TPA: ABC transporter permease [Vicinamibacterales bacterium]|nr:ABC transporter permease [Vicinamibacterales bacterium]